MSAETGYEGLAAVLSEHPGQLVARWREVYRESALRIPGPCDVEGLSTLVSSVLESMAEALPISDVEPGEPRLRELEKSFSFVGSVMAGSGSSGFDVAGLVVALRDVLLERVEGRDAEQLCRLFDWLFVLVLDAFATAGVRGERERHRENVERSTPVVLVTPDIPAVFLIGEIDNLVLDAILGRVLMMTVRVGAASVIMDVSGLEKAHASTVMVALERFMSHRKVSGDVHVIAVGLDEQGLVAWRQVAQRSGATLHAEDSFDRALTRALGRTGFRIVRRP